MATITTALPGAPETGVGTFVQGGVSVVLLTFLNDTIRLMLPFIILSIVLITVDLFFGVPAAKLRGERVSMSRGLRMTCNKIMEYICWIILAASLAVAFEWPPLNWLILALVIGNEMVSIVTNWLFLHGKKVKGLDDVLVKWLGSKVAADVSEVEIEDVKTGETIRKRSPQPYVDMSEEESIDREFHGEL